MNRNVAETRKLIQSFNKSSPLGLYVLLEIWNIERKISDPKMLKFTAKYIYKLMDSFEIPNHLWIKGHILCAKTLIRDKVTPHYAEAVGLLKDICQVLPPLPLLENGASFSIRQDLLQSDPECEAGELTTKAEDGSSILNIFEGRAPSVPIAKVKEQHPEKEGDEKAKHRISIIEMQMNNYTAEFKKLPRKFSQPEGEDTKEEVKAVQEVHETIKKSHARKCSAYMQQLMAHNRTPVDPLKASQPSAATSPESEQKPSRRMRSFKPSIGYMPKGLLQTLKNDSKAAEQEIKYESQLFSVSTQSDYLYLMGRIAVQYDVDVKFGVQTLSDLVGLLNLFMNGEGLTGLKTKYWIAAGLQKMGRVEEACKILQGIPVPAGENKLKFRVDELLAKCKIEIEHK